MKVLPLVTVASVVGISVWLGEQSMKNRGKLVGPKTVLENDGIIPSNPQALADASYMPLDVYSLARAISSEHGQDSPVTKQAVAWAMFNKAKKSGRSTFDQLTRAKYRDGRKGQAHHLFSKQNVPGPNKYASTALDPRQQDAQIAWMVWAGYIPDITNGATNFFSPKAQRALHRRNPATWDTPEEVSQRWAKSGLQAVNVEGVDPDLVQFFKPA